MSNTLFIKEAISVFLKPFWVDLQRSQWVTAWIKRWEPLSLAWFHYKRCAISTFLWKIKSAAKVKKKLIFKEFEKEKKKLGWPWILMKASFSPLRQPRQGLWTSRICPRSQPSLLSAMVETSATSWQRSCLLDLENWLCFNVVCWFV